MEDDRSVQLLLQYVEYARHLSEIHKRCDPQVAASGLLHGTALVRGRYPELPDLTAEEYISKWNDMMDLEDEYLEIVKFPMVGDILRNALQNLPKGME